MVPLTSNLGDPPPPHEAEGCSSFNPCRCRVARRVRKLHDPVLDSQLLSLLLLGWFVVEMGSLGFNFLDTHHISFFNLQKVKPFAAGSTAPTVTLTFFAVCLCPGPFCYGPGELPRAPEARARRGGRWP